jgi:hypothetical protein
VLLLSPEFVRTHEETAEALVRAALATGADVEVPSGSAAERLDRAAAGIAARLRFAVEAPEGSRVGVAAAEHGAAAVAGDGRAHHPVHAADAVRGVAAPRARRVRVA